MNANYDRLEAKLKYMIVNALLIFLFILLIKIYFIKRN